MSVFNPLWPNLNLLVAQSAGNQIPTFAFSCLLATAGDAMVVNQESLRRNAEAFLKTTKDPALAASLPADLKSKVDDSSPSDDKSPRAPDVQTPE